MMKITIDRWCVILIVVAIVATPMAHLLVAGNSSVPTKPFNFTPGQVIKSSEVNSDLDTIYSELSNIGRANILADGVDTTQLKDSSVTSAKILDGAIVAGDIANYTLTGILMATEAITARAIKTAGLTGDLEATQTITERAVAATTVPRAGYVNVVINPNAGAATTKVDVTADSVTTTDGTFTQNVTQNYTIDTATTGANALDTGTRAANSNYYVWAIAKPGGAGAALASLSSTAPTMPSGYTFKRRIGSFRSASGNTIIDFRQFGQDTRFVLRQEVAHLVAAVIDSSPPFSSRSQSSFKGSANTNYVPTTAVVVHLSSQITSIAGTIVELTMYYTREGTATDAIFVHSALLANGTAEGCTAYFDYECSGTNAIEYCTNSGSSRCTIWCSGYVDNF